MFNLIFKDVSEKRIPIMLCANKVDTRAEAMANGRKCITIDDGERMAREHSAIFIETSAKDGKNVIDALVQLSRYQSKYNFQSYSALENRSI